jgi:hypothetical protein
LFRTRYVDDRGIGRSITAQEYHEAGETGKRVRVCLINPPSVGHYTLLDRAVHNINGKLVRRSLCAADGSKIAGEFKRSAKDDPGTRKNWTNVAAARIALDKLRGGANEGNIAVGNDPSQLHYGDRREMYLNDYLEKEYSSLLKGHETVSSITTPGDRAQSRLISTFFHPFRIEGGVIREGFLWRENFEVVPVRNHLISSQSRKAASNS